MRATERVRDGLRAVVYTGTAAEVDAHLARVRQSGELVGHDRPAPAGRGLWQVRVVLWAAGQPVRVPRTSLPPPPQPLRREPPDWLTPQVARRSAAVLVVLAVLAVAGWLLWQAVRSAAAWTTDHSGQIATVLVLATLGVVAWLGRKAVAWLGRLLGGRSQPVCVTQHGPRCRHH